MLNKDHCKILKFLNTINMNGCRATLISLKTNLDLDDVHQMLVYLESIRCVEQLPNCNWRILYNGKKYKHTYHSQLFQKYWFPIITASISFLLSLLSNLLLK